MNTHLSKQFTKGSFNRLLNKNCAFLTLSNYFPRVCHSFFSLFKETVEQDKRLTVIKEQSCRHKKTSVYKQKGSVTAL